MRRGDLLTDTVAMQSFRCPEATTAAIPILLDANPGYDIAYESIRGVIGPPFDVLDAARKKVLFFLEYLSILQDP